MKRKVAIFTGTRAEYGLLYWLMKGFLANKNFELQVIVSGTHLSPEFGETYRDICADGFLIDAKVEILLSSDTPVGIAKSMGLGAIGFADALDRLQPDLLVVLGDRFEALAIAQVALVMKIPIAHLHGGEISEGAYDDAIRHAITKMASLHFVAAAPYRNRVIQMGEDPGTVFNVGALGLDHLLYSSRMSINELSASLQFKFYSQFFLITYHPVTLLQEDPQASFQALLDALDKFPQYQLVFTYPNADNGGRSIISMLERFAAERSARVIAVPSLGFLRYLSVLSHSAAVIGNSSSGIIEAPSFNIPTVNIGCRQQGRLCAGSVINCSVDTQSIVDAIELAISPDFKMNCQDVVNPYGKGDAAKNIIEIIEAEKVTFPKKFYNLESLM